MSNTIDTLQIFISTLWLRYFNYGPFEWVWRSLTYWRRQPMRKTSSIELVRDSY